MEPLTTDDRVKPLPGRQREYLDGMDERMDRGFELNGVRIDTPEIAQRAQLVTLHLIDALQDAFLQAFRGIGRFEQ